MEIGTGKIEGFFFYLYTGTKAKDSKKKTSQYFYDPKLKRRNRRKKGIRQQELVGAV
jgi:hypothetical protein